MSGISITLRLNRHTRIAIKALSPISIYTFTELIDFTICHAVDLLLIYANLKQRDGLVWTKKLTLSQNDEVIVKVKPHKMENISSPE